MSCIIAFITSEDYNFYHFRRDSRKKGRCFSCIQKRACRGLVWGRQDVTNFVS